jgi:predicted transcriptional regulator
MTTSELLERVRRWPAEDQQELADYARVIEARRTGLYRLSDEERQAVREGLAEADRGEFVSDDEVAAQDKRHGA